MTAVTGVMSRYCRPCHKSLSERPFHWVSEALHVTSFYCLNISLTLRKPEIYRERTRRLTEHWAPSRRPRRGRDGKQWWA